MVDRKHIHAVPTSLDREDTFQLHRILEGEYRVTIKIDSDGGLSIPLNNLTRERKEKLYQTLTDALYSY